MYLYQFQQIMAAFFCIGILLVTQISGQSLQGHERVSRRMNVQFLRFSNFLADPGQVSGPPIQQLPDAQDGKVCPPQPQLENELTEVTLIIVITSAQGCYEFKTPGYDAGGYPNADKRAYQCNYEIRLPDNTSPTISILKSEFNLQQQNNNFKCPNDVFILKNIVETGQSTDDVADFSNNVNFCGNLTEDKLFQIEPGTANNNRFQISFKANKNINGLGVRGLLCF